MPQPVTNVYQADMSKLMNPGSEKRQSLRGFDDEFVDLPDYIVRITHKIWEERGVGLIYNYYNNHAIMHSDYGTTYGVEAVVISTLQYQAAFPSDKGFAEDVIWSGNDVDGFYSSHRWRNVGLHTGCSIYGLPTWRQIIRNGFADCCVRENRIYEEWVVRDGMSMLRQMGIDPRQHIADLVKTGKYDWMRAESYGDIERLRGQLPPPIMPPKQAEGFDVEDFVRRSYHEIWNWRLLNQVEAYYAQNHVAHLPDDRELHGRSALAYFVTCMLAMFPDGAMDIDHFAALGNEQDGYRVATRWTFQGTHQGYGIYGAPTNKRVRITGISHHHIKDGQYFQEWTVFDEVALLLQLAI